MNCSDVLVSVIVPVYNVEQYIEKCIESILAQTHQNFELILVDDGSPDKAGEICDRYAESDSRIKVIHKENGGLSSARNAGIDIASGDYYIFVDSDDFINIHTLEVTVSNCVKNDCEICIFSSFDTPEHSIAYDTTVSNNYNVYELTYLLEKYFSFPIISYNSSSCNKLFKASIFNTLRFPVGMLYEDTAIRFHTLFQAKKICITDAVLYYYYLSPNSIMRSPFKEKSLDILKVTQINLDFLKDKNCSHIEQSLLAQYEYDVCRLYAQLCLSSLDNKKELKIQLKADKKRISKINKNNPYFTKRMKLLSSLFYYCPPIYKLKRFM